MMKRLFCTMFLGVAFFTYFSCEKNLTDIDGNKYQTVKIGDQLWMAENLKVTRYRNGELIPEVMDNNEWCFTEGAYCNYSDDATKVAIYGRLYNWYAVIDSSNIAPIGWHVPTDAEWQTLVDYLGGDSVAGGKMKETGVTHWNVPNTGATNESGFSALPGGFRLFNGSYVYIVGYRINDGTYYDIGYYGLWWSATEDGSGHAWYRGLDCSSSDMNRNNAHKQGGFSVRCVKD